MPAQTKVAAGAGAASIETHQSMFLTGERESRASTPEKTAHYKNNSERARISTSSTVNEKAQSRYEGLKSRTILRNPVARFVDLPLYTAPGSPV